jgi:hypothetical protein
MDVENSTFHVLNTGGRIVKERRASEESRSSMWQPPLPGDGASQVAGGSGTRWSPAPFLGARSRQLRRNRQGDAKFFPFALVQLDPAANLVEAALFRDETKEINTLSRSGWKRPAAFRVCPRASDCRLPV